LEAFKVKNVIYIFVFILIGCKTFKQPVLVVTEKYTGEEIRATGNVVLSEDGKSVLEVSIKKQLEITLYNNGTFIWILGPDTSYTEYFGKYERKSDTLLLKTKMDWSVYSKKEIVTNAFVYKAEKVDKIIPHTNKKDTMLVLTRSGLIYLTKAPLENKNATTVRLNKNYVGHQRKERMGREPDKKWHVQVDDYILNLKKNGTYSMRILHGPTDFKHTGSWFVYPEGLLLMADRYDVNNADRKQGSYSLITKIQIRDSSTLYVPVDRLLLKKK